MRKLLIGLAAILFATGAFAATVGDDMTYEGTVTISGATTLSGTTTISGATTFSSTVLLPTETAAAANVITASECGTIFYLSHATEFASTLPAISTVSAGCTFEFIIAAAPSGADYTVLSGNSLENLIHGIAVVAGASVAGATEDTITFTGGAAVVGDWVRLTSDGSAWYVSGQAVASTGITLTQAD